MSYPASSGYSSDRNNSWSKTDDIDEETRRQTGHGAQFYNGKQRWYGYDNKFPDMSQDRKRVDLGTNGSNLTFDNALGDSMKSKDPYDFIPHQDVWSSKRIRKLPKLPTDDTTAAVKKSRRRCWIMIISSLTVLLFFIAAGVVYARLTCMIGLCNASTEEPQSGSPCDGTSTVELESSTNFTCVVAIDTPTALAITQGNANTVLSEANISFDDDAEQAYIADKMTVTLSKDESGDTHIIVEFIRVNCEVQGTYYVNVTNGTHSTAYKVEVQIKPGVSFCPCKVVTNVGLEEKIVCKVKDDAQESLQIRIEFGTETIVSSVSINDVLVNDGRWNISNRITLTASSIGTAEQTSISLEFTNMLCTDDGMYTITIGNTTYETKLKVLSEHQDPRVTVDHDHRGGLVMGRDGQIQCAAKVGCSKNATLKLFSRNSNRLDYEELTQGISNMTRKLTETGYDIKLQLDIEKSHLKAIAEDKYFKCTYLDNDGELHESDILYTKPISESFCKDITFGCHVVHPYDCGKYVRCVPHPVEMSCQNGLQFQLKKSKCDGECDWPYIVKCDTGNK